MKNGRNEVFRALSLILQVGLTVIVPFIGFLYLGKWIDGKAGTSCFTVILMLLGLSGGLSGAWKLLRASYRREDPPEEKYDLMEGFRPEDREEAEKDSHEK